MNFHIVTIFPESFESYLNSSILERAQIYKKIKIKFYNPRDFTKDKHHKVDAKPYSGGPGMVMQVEPILKAVDLARKNKKNVKIILFSTSGKQFNNKIAADLSKKCRDIILICGHYEGVDYRVKKILRAEEISIGPYILTGGELPAMAIVDSVARQIKGVLGTYESIEEKRIVSPEVYSRPETFRYKGKKYSVPKVLLSGNHKEIEVWKAKRQCP